MRAGLPPNTGGTAEKIFRPGHDGSRARGFVISLGKEHRHETGLPEIQTLRPHRPAGPHLAGQDHHPGPRLVQRRPAGRQPGPGKPHEPGAEAGILPDPVRDRISGDRGGLSRLLRDGVRDLTCPHRPGPDPRRRDGAGAGPGPGAPDPQDLRGHPGGQKRHHPLLQLHLHPPAAGGVPHGHGGRHPDRRRRRPAHPPPHRGAHGQRGRGHPLRVLPRELFRHRGGELRAHLRPGAGGAGGQPGAEGYPQPAQHRGALHPQHLRRPGGVRVPPLKAPGLRHRKPAPPQRPGYRHCRHGAGPDGWGPAGGGHPLRQRGAHRQRGHYEPGAEPLLPEGGPGAGLLPHEPSSGCTRSAPA